MVPNPRRLAVDAFAEFIAGIDDVSHRDRTVEVLSWVAETFPQLGQVVKWKQPMFTDHGTFIIGFSVSKNHIAVAPEPPVVAKFAQQLDRAGYSRTNMLFRIGWDQPVDYELLRAIIQFNIDDKAGYSPFWRKPEKVSE